MRQTQNASKKDNRRSILVIGLLLLLVAVIGFGGYTMSKYVTKKSVQGNTAQVAKWGFTVTAENNKLFGDKYSNGKIAATDDKLTVKADSAGTNLVAPSLSGSMTFTVAGKAEVLAQVSVAMEAADGKAAIEDVVLNYKNYKKGGTAGTYSPVKWTLTRKSKGETVATALVNEGTLANVQTELAKLYNANTAIATELNDEYTLSWAWAFENTANPDTDALDTLLGWKANGTDIPGDYGFTVEAGTCTNISFSIEISVTQVQTVA